MGCKREVIDKSSFFKKLLSITFVTLMLLGSLVGMMCFVERVQAAETGTIRGQVKNNETQWGIPNATVMINRTDQPQQPASVLTDSNGNYTFNDNVSVGNYNVTTYKEGEGGFQQVNASTAVFANETSWVNFSITLGDGGSMPFHLDQHSSTVTPRYIQNGTQKKFNFTIKQHATSAQVHNITINLPTGFTYVGNNGTTLNDQANYTVSNTSNMVKWNKNNTDGFLFNSTEYFWFNATSTASLGSGQFNITVNGNDGTPQNLSMTVFTTINFSYTGTVKDVNGQNLSGAVASISVQSFTDGPPVTLGTFNGTTHADGSFNITGIPTTQNVSNLSGGFGPGAGSEGGLFYRLSAAEYNDSSNNYAINISISLPSTPVSELVLGLQNPEIYLKPAISFRVRANGSFYSWNESSQQVELTYASKQFQVMVKDQKLGFPVKEFTGQAYERIFSVPKGRNYSLSIFSEQSFPISVRFNNITWYCGNRNGNFDISGVTTNCTAYNGTYLVDVCVNTSSSNVPLTGYFNNITSPEYMRVVAYTMEDQDMVFEDWALPFNLGNETGNGVDDVYDLSAREYNVSLPATVAPSYLMLRAYAKNASGYYMGSHITNTSNGNLNETSYNFTMSPLIQGINRTISANNVSDRWNQTRIVNTTTTVLFNLVNSTGSLLSTENAFVEIKRELNGTEYMQMINGQNGQFNVSLLQGSSIKKLTIYSQQYAPISTPISASVLNGSENTTTIHMDYVDGTCNITLRSFGDFDPLGENADFGMMMYKSNDTCNVPNPPQSCDVCGEDQGEMNKTAFSPLKAILKGDISMMIKCGNISVYYLNTDLLASGPPDASFSTNATEGEGGLAAVWKFGSQGPEIYDAVLIGMPYSANLLDKTINVTIPLLYDNEFNVIWNSSAGDNVTDISTNDALSDYRDYLNTPYEAYLNGTGVTCNESDRTLSSGLGYKDTANQTIWIKIPHFSGVGPEVNGMEPDPPGSFTATSASSSQIDLSWGKGSKADYTHVQRKTGGYPTNTSDGVNVYNGTGTSKSDTGLSASTTYFYRAWSWNSTEGLWSTSNSSDSDATEDSGGGGGTTTPTIPPSSEDETTEEEASTTKEDVVENLFNVSLGQNFFVNASDGDGILELDEFYDPNGVLSAERVVNISGNSTFLISVNGSKEDIFIWDTEADIITGVTYNAGTITSSTTDAENDTITVTVTVNKTDWIYIEVTDEHPGISNLTVKTSDNRTITSDMIFRENGKIFVLDDPYITYMFDYHYTTLTPTFNPVSGTVFDVSKPTITITYNERMTVIEATLNGGTIALTTTDNQIFTYTPENNLTNDEYVLTVTVKDSENNTRTDSATYTLGVEESSEENQWITALVIAVIIVLIILVIIALLFKRGYLHFEEKNRK